MIRLRAHDFRKYMALKGWSQAETARRMGIDPSTLWRALLPPGDPRHYPPSAKFVSGALRAFPELSFEDMFIVDDAASREFAFPEGKEGKDSHAHCGKCAQPAEPAPADGRRPPARRRAAAPAAS